MDFTVNVGRKDPKEDFSITSLRMKHEECAKGKVVVTVEERNKSNTMQEYHLVFTCRRCGIKRSFPASDENRMLVAMLATEGGNLKIKEVSLICE